MEACNRDFSKVNENASATNKDALTGIKNVGLGRKEFKKSVFSRHASLWEYSG